MQELAEVDSSSSTNVWAVGRYWKPPTETRPPTPYIQRWDGRSWTLVEGPADEEDANYYSIEALSPNEVWILGGSQRLGEFASHWDGKAWTSHTFARVLPGALAGRASDDVWAVGETDVNGAAVALHWNGRSWKKVANPIASGRGVLLDISVTRDGAAWAVGYAIRGTVGTSGVSSVENAVLRWTGTRWIRTPDRPLRDAGRFEEIAASSRDDVWVVGMQRRHGQPGGYAAHWNGVRWSYTPSARPGVSELLAVAATPPHVAWTAGSGSSRGVIVKRWTDARWVGTVVGHRRESEIKGLAAIGQSEVWAVGSTDSFTAPQSSIEHFSCS
jgi:hypothetical protein